MKVSFVKQLVVLLFFFAVVERPGIPVFSWLLSSNNTAISKFIEMEDESTEPESENTTKLTSSLTDFLHIPLAYLVQAPISTLNNTQRMNSQCIYSLSFYPAVLTPPPDDKHLS